MVHEKNFPIICAEIYDCLNILGDVYIQCIPKGIYQSIEKNRDLNYISKYNSSIGINKEIFSHETLNILAGIDLEYWCTEEEKKRKTELYNHNEEEYQKQIREKYNPDNIFKNRKKENIQTVEQVETQMAIIEYKESIFTKIKKWLKNIFNKS